MVFAILMAFCRALSTAGSHATTRPATHGTRVTLAGHRAGQLCANTIGRHEDYAGLSCTSWTILRRVTGSCPVFFSPHCFLSFLSVYYLESRTQCTNKCTHDIDIFESRSGRISHELIAPYSVSCAICLPTAIQVGLLAHRF